MYDCYRRGGINNKSFGGIKMFFVLSFLGLMLITYSLGMAILALIQTIKYKKNFLKTFWKYLNN